MKLVIVESPAKGKTIEGFLGKGYKVLSSYGHVRDLPKSKLGIDVKKNFEPQYVIPPSSKEVISALKKEVKRADEVILAADEDREGEAIAWHLAQALGLSRPARIVFHEITKSAIENALKEPRGIDEDLVEAQQARRVLDRLVGYELSPILWRKVRPGLSAGRVQSSALRLLVEREREISSFEPSVFFQAAALFGGDLKAQLKEPLSSLEEAKAFLERVSGAVFTVSSMETKPARRSPSAPFTTSTLQQEASRRLGFSPRRTMRAAQRLYESGQITYMRTDSVALSSLALQQAQEVISKEFGGEYRARRQYKTKAARAQEAHEAVRPTDLARKEAAGGGDEKRLYQLIYKRTLASQMAPARLERTTVKISPSTSDKVFEAKGEVIVFDGFLRADPPASQREHLPKLKQGQELILTEASARETFTKPKPRYTEASLVRELEELGIGRPSTYAPIISTVQEREYAEKTDVEGTERAVRVLTLKDGSVTTEKETERAGADKGKLVPTELGMVVSDFLFKHFPSVVDYGFTANVEEELDEIAVGKKERTSMLSSFYKDFHEAVEGAKDVSREEASQTRELGEDPQTKKPVLARIGRYGPMVQLGRADSQEEKPRFAPLPPNTSVKDVTLKQALKMLSLPRALGQEKGEEITVQSGRFGPYVKKGSVNVSIPEDKLFTLTKQEAVNLLKEKQKQAEENTVREFADETRILRGRYGPYITDGTKNAKMPKDKDPEKLTFEEAKELLSKAPARRFTRRKKRV